MDFIALKEGTTLNHDTYVIKYVLGKGGFGITYLAHDRKLDKDVAIKEFFPRAYCSRDGHTNHITPGTQGSYELVSELKNKFLKEARNIAKLNHPNIIKIYTAFEENSTAYYVMEYIKGQSLNQLVKNNGPLSSKLATNYINEIGSALEYLHACHMTHFDVKPANIMLRASDNVPVLIDFGLSKNYDQTGHQTTTQGLSGVSPGYSPLEQYSMGGNKKFSPRSDLYSLAATYYFLLTGRTPEEATSNPASSLFFPSHIAKNISSAIVKAMSSDINNRHDSVSQFLTSINSTQIDPDPSKKTYNGILIGVICALVIALCIALVSNRNRSDEINAGGQEQIDPEEDTAKTPNLGQTVNVASSEDTSSIRKEEITEKVPAQKSEYGPFNSRDEVKDYITRYSNQSQEGRMESSMIADRITTDFGTPRSFTRSEFLSQLKSFHDKSDIISSHKDVNWSSMIISPLDNGGLKVSFSSVYELTKPKKGELVDLLTQEFSLYTDLYINSNKQIYKYKETTKKIGEWDDM